MTADAVDPFELPALPPDAAPSPPDEPAAKKDDGTLTSLAELPPPDPNSPPRARGSWLNGSTNGGFGF